MDKLAQLSDAELETAQQDVMAERAKVHDELKAKAAALAAEFERRVAERRIEALLEAMSEDERAALRARLGEGD